jgi:acetyltransferase-like isoleucine patch superfamily enzyme
VNKKLKQLYNFCKESDSSFLSVLTRHLYFKFKGKQIIAHQEVIIKGLNNIETKDLLNIGIDDIGFIHKKDITYLHIRGKMKVLGRFLIGRGCRFDIGPLAEVKLGKGSYINPFSKVIIMHGLEIGENCSISWNCQFLDEDFHLLSYENKKTIIEKRIIIGDNVWIGSNVSVYKGSYIPNGCVVASNSVVKDVFVDENTLIAGNPAKVIKRNIVWSKTGMYKE